MAMRMINYDMIKYDQIRSNMIKDGNRNGFWIESGKVIQWSDRGAQPTMMP